MPFRVPVREKHNRGPRGSRTEKARVHEIIFRPGRHNLARKCKNSATGCAIFRRMQDIIVRGRCGKPLIAVRQRFIHPAMQICVRIGFIAAPANVFQPPFEGIDTAIIVGSPPGVLVAANFLFEPGHNL